MFWASVTHQLCGLNRPLKQQILYPLDSKPNKGPALVVGACQGQERARPRGENYLQGGGMKPSLQEVHPHVAGRSEGRQGWSGRRARGRKGLWTRQGNGLGFHPKSSELIPLSLNLDLGKHVLELCSDLSLLYLLPSSLRTKTCISYASLQPHDRRLNKCLSDE